jgi:hypothetical protein
MGREKGYRRKGMGEGGRKKGRQEKGDRRRETGERGQKNGKAGREMGEGETSFPGLPVKGWVKNGKTTGVTGPPPLPVPSTGT